MKRITFLVGLVTLLVGCSTVNQKSYDGILIDSPVGHGQQFASVV